MKPAAKPDDYSPVELAYAGMRQGGRKLFQMWVVINKDGIANDDLSAQMTRAYTNLVRGPTVGAVYLVLSTSSGGALTSGARKPEFRRVYKDAEAVVRWKAEDTAAQVSDRARRNTAQILKRDHLRELLAPVREAYNKTDALGQAAILAWVMKSIIAPWDKT